MRGTHLLILTAPTLRALQRFMMTARNNGEGFMPGAGKESVGVCDNTMSDRSGFICVYCKFLLEAGG